MIIEFIRQSNVLFDQLRFFSSLGYLIPFLQQVSMHAALAFLLILTIHRCYPAGVPRFLQGDFIRRQIRNYPQTLTILWIFAILINLPLFAITKYETIQTNETVHLENNTNVSLFKTESSCYTDAPEIWSRTYLILLLVCTYLITGIFLIIIYGQVIRILLASKKYTPNSMRNSTSNCDSYRYLSPSNYPRVKNQSNHEYHAKFLHRTNPKIPGQSPASSTTSAGSNRRRTSTLSPVPLLVRHSSQKSPANSHSVQHLQVIVMLFIVILLYILLLLPYRLLNLLYIVHNQLFHQNFMNETLFRWLLNTVRLLVFLNCALQPMTYLIISSRLRQTVLKLLRLWFTCFCRCQCSASPATLQTNRHYKSDTRAIRAYLSQKHQPTTRYPNRANMPYHGEQRFNPNSFNNRQLLAYPATPLNSLTISRSPSPIVGPHVTNPIPFLPNSQLRR